MICCYGNVHATYPWRTFFTGKDPRSGFTIFLCLSYSTISLYPLTESQADSCEQSQVSSLILSSLRSSGSDAQYIHGVGGNWERESCISTQQILKLVQLSQFYLTSLYFTQMLWMVPWLNRLISTLQCGISSGCHFSSSYCTSYPDPFLWPGKSAGDDLSFLAPACMWEIGKKLLAPSFGSAQPWTLRLFGEWTSGYKTSLCFLFSCKCASQMKINK